MAIQMNIINSNIIDIVGSKRREQRNFHKNKKKKQEISILREIANGEFDWALIIKNWRYIDVQKFYVGICLLKVLNSFMRYQKH